LDRGVVVVDDRSTSTLDRLRNKAKETGKSFQVLLQLFCQEEMLRKVALSNYSSSLVLKGGMFIYCLCGFESRPTVDIDFLLRHQSNSLDEIEKMIRTIIDIDTGNDFISLEIRKVEPIAERREYNGVRVQMIGRIKNTRLPFDIDFGLGDVIVPNAEKRVMASILSDFDSSEVNTYSIESTIAEKFDAIISRMELTSRMKDYYDIYFLAHSFNFDGRKLQEAVFETLQNRGTPYDKDTFESIINFAEQDDMNLKWQYFLRKLNVAKPDFDEIINVLSIFLGGIFEAIVSENEFFGYWDNEGCQWSSFRKKQ